MPTITFSANIREDVKIPTYKPHTNHKRSSVKSHTLAPTTICDFSHSFCWSPLTDLGHISSVTYVCHPLWFVCGHRKGILTSPLTMNILKAQISTLIISADDSDECLGDELSVSIRVLQIQHRQVIRGQGYGSVQGKTGLQ